MALETLRAAKAAGDRAREARAYGRAIDLYFMRSLPETALEIWNECRQAGLAAEVPATTRLRVARQLERGGDDLAACGLYAELYDAGAAERPAFQALVAHARVLVRHRRKHDALALLGAARAWLRHHAESADAVAMLLREAGALPDEPAKARVPAP